MQAMRRHSIALLILRLTLGSIFILHGSQKLFGFFGGSGLTGFVQWSAKLGIPAVLAYIAAFAEFFGGVSMFFGIATELGALMTIPVMIGAVVIVHGKSGYFAQNGGFEYPLNLIFLAIAIIIGGPGLWALYKPFKK